MDNPMGAATFRESNGETASVEIIPRWFRRLNSPDLFLTFDDGPNSEVTPSLLELLDRYGATATFFLTGESLKARNSEEILASIIRRGHTVGNHGLFHARGSCPRFDKMRKLIAGLGGVDTRLVRPPYGSRLLLDRHFAEDPDSVAFHWTHLFGDWLPVNFDQISRQLSALVTPGAILLLHDGFTQDDLYCDRRQVLGLTELICTHARSRGIQIKGLAALFPHLHQRI